MDRRAWLADRRDATRAVYDAEAAAYDLEDYPHDAQVGYVARVLAACPSGGLVLDAPCGTGRYFAQVRAAGCRVVGVDQSAGMLAVARARGIAERLEQIGLQELAFDGVFDAVLTIDAMENVPPEDWPLVLANLCRAAKPGALLYITVEEVLDEGELDEAHAAQLAQGYPAVPGEVIEGDVAAYHFYPGRDRVLGWIADAHLDVLEEAYVHARDAWGYRHFLLRAPTRVHRNRTATRGALSGGPGIR